MDRFLDCLLRNDLQQLIISGIVPESKLQEAWDKIYVEYCQLSNDGSYNEVFELLKEINDLRAKIAIVCNIVKHLQLSYDKDLIDILNVLALRCNINESDKGDQLIDKLNTVIARIKKWFPKLKQSEANLEKIRADNTDKVNDAYFDDIFESMSEVKGYQVEAGKITVSRFCRSLIKMSELAQKRLAQMRKVV